MKQLIIILAAFVALSGFSENKKAESGIYGQIDPQDGAKKVWAVAGTDSVSTIPNAGKFALAVKPGTWTLVVEANAPYKNAVIQSVLVLEGSPTDAGTIKLTN